jgi:hypothetical protein
LTEKTFDPFTIFNKLIQKMSDKFSVEEVDRVSKMTPDDKLMAMYELEGILNAIKKECDFIYKGYSTLVNKDEYMKAITEAFGEKGLEKLNIKTSEDMDDVLALGKKKPSGNNNLN